MQLLSRGSLGQEPQEFREGELSSAIASGSMGDLSVPVFLPLKWGYKAVLRIGQDSKYKNTLLIVNCHPCHY